MAAKNTDDDAPVDDLPADDASETADAPDTDDTAADATAADDSAADDQADTGAGRSRGSKTRGATATGTKKKRRTDRDQRAKDTFSHRLYTGEAGLDFVGKRKVTFIASGLLLLASIALLVFKGLNFGIDFVGGNTFEVPASPSQIAQAEAVVQNGLDQATQKAREADPEAPEGVIATSQTVGTGAGTSILIKTTELPAAEATAIAQALADEFRPEIEERLQAAGTEITDETVLAQVSNQSIDATWGGDVSRKAIIALGVFLIAVSVFLRFRYRWGLVLGAMIALLHDLVVTAGIYALIGFEVTPATVIGMLTILGFSLYDTVVVFDKVDENTKPLLAGSRMTYSEAANLAINQTLIRSINTSVISLLPILALLFVGAGLLGAGTLKDLALVLAVGVVAGVYSSVFLAAPIAAHLAEKQPEYQALAKRVTARRAAGKDRDIVAARQRGAKRRSTAVVRESDDDAVATAAPAKPRPKVGTTPKPGAKPARKGKR